MDNPIFKLEKVVQAKGSEPLEDFEGPLDLILFLLSKNKIEIQDIPIALILDQYQEYLEQRKQMDLEVASEFVAMAAHLMYIKTRMLLNLEDDQYTAFAASISSMMVRSYAVAIVKPAEGKTDAVKAALEAYVASEQQSMEHYLEDQYLVAKAATVTVAPTGEVVLVCAEDHDTILSNIEKALAA